MNKPEENNNNNGGGGGGPLVVGAAAYTPERLFKEAPAQSHYTKQQQLQQLTHTYTTCFIYILNMCIRVKRLH